MGLDVYLYKFNGEDLQVALDAKKEHHDITEEISSKIWDESLKGRQYSELSEDEHEDRRQKTREALEAYIKENDLPLITGDYGLELDETEIELNSNTDPEHMFKIGYIRSSYNDAGINRILENKTGKTLYDVFNPNEEYEFIPDWTKAKEELQYLLTVLENDAGYQVFDVTPNAFSDHELPPTSREALNVFMEEMKKEHPFDGGYSNINGHFYPEGITVHGFISGTNNILSKGLPTTYIIYKNDEGVKWYIDAVKIMIEMVDYVLSQTESDKYYLHWSS